jgi:membrane protein
MLLAGVNCPTLWHIDRVGENATLEVTSERQMKLPKLAGRSPLWDKHGAPTLRFCMETEVHVYAFSIAANVLLSFFPFLIVMVSICRHVLSWRAAEHVIYFALREYFPDPLGAFIQRNLRAAVDSAGAFQIVSILLLLFTANGIFEPLEVALNRVWGITKNRSYLRNQAVSLALIFACGSLALASTTLTAAAANEEVFREIPYLAGAGINLLKVLIFRSMAIPASILALFLIYWLLPNGKIAARSVVPVAVGVGIMLEALKYVNLLVWPWLRAKLEHEYGPFAYSVTIVLWSFLGAMILLSGAEWVARNARNGAGGGVAAGGEGEVAPETGVAAGGDRFNSLQRSS